MNSLLWIMGIFIGIIILFFIIRYILIKLVDSRIESYQSDLVAKHFNEVENNYKQMRVWRHDYHNHIQVMKAYLELGKYDDMDDYLSQLEEDLTNIDRLLKTGNLMVDAILNSKLSMAISQDIDINAKATVPEE